MNQITLQNENTHALLFILGSLKESDTVTRKVVDCFHCTKLYFSSYQHFQHNERPNIVLIVGDESLSQWVDLTVKIGNQADSPICFIALTDALEFRHHLKMIQHEHFVAIQPHLGFQACLQKIKECMSFNCEANCDTAELQLVVVGSENEFEKVCNDFSAAPSLVATFLQNVECLFSLVDCASCVILINAELINEHNANELKVIATNTHLNSIPLVLFGNSQKQLSLSRWQLYFSAFLITPIDIQTLNELTHSLVAEFRKRDEVKKQLFHIKNVDSQITDAINSHAIVSRTDKSGVITYVNPLFCEISQYSEDELIGKTHSIVNSKYHPKSFFVDMWKTIISGKIWRGLVRNRKRNGGFYWVDSTIVPIPNQARDGYDFMSIRTEVTEIMRNQERFSEGQAFAKIGLFDLNLENDDVFCNDIAAKIIGYEKATDISSFEQVTNHIHINDRKNYVKTVKQCIGSNSQYEIEYRVITTGKQVRWIKEIGEVKQSSEGEPKRLAGVVTDITEQKQFEMELEAARIGAEKASQSKSKFLASMSHELRTPMNAIIGFAQLLQMNIDNPLNKTQMDYVVEILGAGRHLLQLIDEVLNLAEIESGKINLTMKRVNLGEVLHDVLSLSYPIISKMEVNLQVVYNGDNIDNKSLKLLDVLVRADSIRIKQVFLNLISNACKYNYKGGSVIIDIKRGANHSILVTVKDTGAGIEPEKQELLFQPFNRLGAELSEIEGTGIGLIITKQLVELMGGSIGFFSEQNRGSEFWVSIPIEERRIQARNETGNQQKEISMRGTKSNNTAHKSILYVEDNPANLRLVTQLLGRLPNLKLYTANNAESGLKLIDETRFDLVLMDINLPDMNGLTAMREIRSNNKFDSMPIAAVSANAMPDEIQQALNAGFDSYITKPIDISHFMVEIDNLLRLRA